MPQSTARPQAKNAQGQVIEFNGTGWVPAQSQPTAPAMRPEQIPGLTNPTVQSEMNTRGTIEGGPEALLQQRMASARAQVPALSKKLSEGVTDVAIGMAGGNLLEAGGKLLPSAKRAQATFKALESTIGRAPVDVSAPGNAALEFLTNSSQGGKGLRAISQFMKRIRTGTPLTYSEARTFYSNVTKLTPDEIKTLKGTDKFLLRQFASALDSSIKQTASNAGQGENYVKAMIEYNKAAKLGRAGKTAVKLGKRAAVTAALGAAGGAGALGVYEAYK